MSAVCAWMSAAMGLQKSSKRASCGSDGSYVGVLSIEDGGRNTFVVNGFECDEVRHTNVWLTGSLSSSGARKGCSRSIWPGSGISQGSGSSASDRVARTACRSVNSDNTQV